MLAESQQNSEKKRVLTKVRRNFLQRKENDEEQVALPDPASRYISSGTIYTLSSSHGLVEFNRRIYIGPQYLNEYFKIHRSIIHEEPCSKAITLSLSPNQNGPVIPWDYVMKRLESYGDLELVTWAHRVRKYNENYPKLMDNYLKTRTFEDPETFMNTKEKLKQISYEIESKYPYYKIVRNYGRYSSKLTEIGYSEGFIKEMGHSMESLLTWTQQKGLPPVFDHECSVYLQALKAFFEGNVISGVSYHEGKEFETCLIDRKGERRAVWVQTIYFVEPTDDGFISSSYFIMKNGSPRMSPRKRQDDSKLKILKQRKVECDQEREIERQ